MRVLAKTDSVVIMTDLPTEQDIQKRMGKGSMLQKAWDAYLLAEIQPYVPKQLGILIRSAELSTRRGSGELVYNTPYARRLYYNPNFNFSKAVNPLAGAYWDRRAAADRRENYWKPHLANLITHMLRGK